MKFTVFSDDSNIYVTDITDDNGNKESLPPASDVGGISIDDVHLKGADEKCRETDGGDSNEEDDSSEEEEKV